MTEQNRTAALPESASPTTELVEDPHGYEEDVDYAQRRALGLRPIYYSTDQPHPDTRPCPAWCGHDGVHRVWAQSPLEAVHSSPALRTVASRYQGAREDDGVLAPHLETYLTQSGTHAPEIRVKRHGKMRGGGMAVWSAVNLSLDDAQELVTVLQHLIAQADAAEMLAQDDQPGACGA